MKEGSDGAHTRKVADLQQVLVTNLTHGSKGIEFQTKGALSVFTVRSTAPLAVTATRLIAEETQTSILGILHVFEAATDPMQGPDTEVSNPLCLELVFSNQEEISGLIDILELLHAHMAPMNGTDNEQHTETRHPQTAPSPNAESGRILGTVDHSGHSANQEE